MKAWPIDPLLFRSLKLEVSEKLPQGKLPCGSQAFIATLPFDPYDVGYLCEAEFTKCWIVHPLIRETCAGF